MEYGVHEIAEGERELALRQKLLEEAQEVLEAKGEALAEELADVVSVVRALAMRAGVTLEEVIRSSEVKDGKRGAFGKFLALDWTEEGE